MAKNSIAIPLNVVSNLFEVCKSCEVCDPVLEVLSHDKNSYGGVDFIFDCKSRKSCKKVIEYFYGGEDT